MAPLEVEPGVQKSVLKLINVTQRSPINPNEKLMKWLGVKGRSVAAHKGIGACVDVQCVCFSVVK